ncbi:hypothetical protein DNTS_002310 [Danionella cerebrum]|uniref:Calponin-homology (CH) domain-containing protein n=1 Tax=Danionella cerebrum TaxID=2873325 RepID=A0A553MSY4_9TELE|nr:hypothetical protein DNTS_002310 [Danionella translucida]
MLGIAHASNQSIKPFKSSDEYLYAMKEDLAEWLGELYQIKIDVNNILEILKTGALLCAHANKVTRVAEGFLQSSRLANTRLPASEVTFVSSAHPATFLARDNITNFINWCRKEMSVPDVLMFETDDLVLHKNEMNVVLCLLEVARRASRFGMASPVLIQLEHEIEQEIQQETEDSPVPPRSFNTQNLDEMVRHQTVYPAFLENKQQIDDNQQLQKE